MNKSFKIFVLSLVIFFYGVGCSSNFSACVLVGSSSESAGMSDTVCGEQ